MVAKEQYSGRRNRKRRAHRYNCRKFRRKRPNRTKLQRSATKREQLPTQSNIRNNIWSRSDFTNDCLQQVQFQVPELQHTLLPLWMQNIAALVDAPPRRINQQWTFEMYKKDRERVGTSLRKYKCHFSGKDKVKKTKCKNTQMMNIYQNSIFN